MRRAHLVGLMLALLFSTCVVGLEAAAHVIDGPKKDPTFGEPQIDAVKKPVKILHNAKVVDFGAVIFQGTIDLNPVLERIRKGEKLAHKNDGSIFLNKEGKLPKKADTEYYREFVFKKQGWPFPGPTRMIIGKHGEVYFTGDHYHTFTRVD